MTRTPDPLLERKVVTPNKFQQYLLEIQLVGGRGGTRTRGPLLAKWAVKINEVPHLVSLTGKRRHLSRSSVEPKLNRKNEVNPFRGTNF